MTQLFQKLAIWERLWFEEMCSAFDTPWDRNWLRKQLNGHVVNIQWKRVPHIPHPRRTPNGHYLHRKAMFRAAQIVCRAIKAGKIPSPKTLPCADCKVRMASQYEHRDYARPLDIEPVCHGCNIKRGPAILSRPVKTNKSRVA